MYSQQCFLYFGEDWREEQGETEWKTTKIPMFWCQIISSKLKVNIVKSNDWLCKNHKKHSRLKAVYTLNDEAAFSHLFHQTPFDLIVFYFTNEILPTLCEKSKHTFWLSHMFYIKTIKEICWRLTFIFFPQNFKLIFTIYLLIKTAWSLFSFLYCNLCVVLIKHMFN